MDYRVGLAAEGPVTEQAGIIRLLPSQDKQGPGRRKKEQQRQFPWELLWSACATENKFCPSA